MPTQDEMVNALRGNPGVEPEFNWTDLIGKISRATDFGSEPRDKKIERYKNMPFSHVFGESMAEGLPTALMGLKPGGVHLWNTPTGNRMQIQGRFQRPGTPINHPATEALPIPALGGATSLHAMLFGGQSEQDPEITAKMPEPGQSMSFPAERFGEFAPPAKEEPPLFAQSAMANVPPAAINPPLPRPKPVKKQNRRPQRQPEQPSFLDILAKLLKGG